MTQRVLARINLAAVRNNLDKVGQLAPESKIMAVVKANAYGHGVADITSALQAADGFAVASVEEGLELRELGRESGVEKSICVLSAFYSCGDIPLLIRYRLTPNLHSQYQVALLEAYNPAPNPLNVWLKFDSGMHRVGIQPGHLDEILTRLEAIEWIGNIGLMSHLACADDVSNDYSNRQIDTFEACTRGYSKMPRSLANSAGIVAWPKSRMNWVRPGIMLYGSSPMLDQSAETLGLQPVMTLESKLISIQQLNEGDSIGYGSTWTCDESMPVGVVACGYGDGYPRQAPSGTLVLIEGIKVPIIGRVSMDMISVDLRACPGAKIGSKVILWGEGLPVDDIAKAAGTISYQLLCSVASRVPRVVQNQETSYGN